MRAHFYVSGNPVHDRCINAMYEGYPGEKERLDITEYSPSDIAVMFGMFKAAVAVSYPRQVVYQQQAARKARTVVIDSGYVRRGNGEEDYYSVGFDGLNGRADFRNANMPSDRWAALGVELLPYREDGNHILLCGQVPWDASIKIPHLQQWMQETVDRIRRRTDRPIVYRPHPKAITPPLMGAGYSVRQPLTADLKDCWAVVTYNSNTGVDAAIAGYPVYVGDIGSMALPIAAGVGKLNGLNSPPLHDRRQWLNNLAYAQWTPQEMKEGKTWEHLMRPAVSS